MSQAQQGDMVKVHYTGKLDDGTIFDSSEGDDPLEFTLGGGQIIPGFEQAVMGMSTGDIKTVSIAPDKAYGVHREDLMLLIEPDMFPSEITPEIGQHLQLRQQEGMIIDAFVADISDAGVTLDANHPLAGQHLTFEIQLVEIA